VTGGTWLSGWLTVVMLAAMPAGTSYELKSYGFGTGGTANSTSSNYAINGIAGDTAGNANSTNYGIKAGETQTKEANVPTVALANNANWYNKLLLTVDPQSNPSDAKFAVAISTDNFATTQYVKSDFTIGSTLTFSDYQTYAAWGSGSGQYIRGLLAGTVYSVKAKAYAGKFTEGPYGPIATAATVNPQLSFDIDVAATDTTTSPPYQISLGNLLPGSVIDSSQRVWVSLETNGESGAKVYVSGQNAGLRSTASAYTISALTGDLGAAQEGFGVQGVSATQSGGGPLSLVSPYDGSSQSVGVADALIRDIFTTAAPVTAGRGSFLLKAKSQAVTPASADYTEILTAIASASF
jgi:hypothetical protein